MGSGGRTRFLQRDAGGRTKRGTLLLQVQRGSGAVVVVGRQISEELKPTEQRLLFNLETKFDFVTLWLLLGTLSSAELIRKA